MYFPKAVEVSWEERFLLKLSLYLATEGVVASSKENLSREKRKLQDKFIPFLLDPKGDSLLLYGVASCEKHALLSMMHLTIGNMRSILLQPSYIKLQSRGRLRIS